MPDFISPQRVAVVGAGMVGLSTAWFLQARGVQVTVFEQAAVAAGASWGNAGWITPGLAAPLPEPAILRAGLRALAASDSPLSIPLRADPALGAFLLGFARHCTARRWQSAMTSFVPISDRALGAYEVLADGGVAARTTEAAPLLACCETAAQRQPLLTELEHIRACGGTVEFEVLDGPVIQEREPVLSGSVRAAVRLLGQRYIDPGAYVAALAASVRRRGGGIGDIRAGGASGATGGAGGAGGGAGGAIREGIRVAGVREDGDGVVLRQAGPGGGESRHDAVVLATGAWLGELARGAGVRTRVQAGRGYSFSVPLATAPGGPLYFPAARLACTPMPGGMLRIAGMMEFQRPGAPPDPRRFSLIADAVRPLIPGAQLDQRTGEWVGSRPCTPDGLPLIGATRSRRVFVAGGHGMWGITLGPVTGQLLADTIVTGTRPPELAPFDPLR